MKWKNFKLTINKILIVAAVAGLLITNALSPEDKDMEVKHSTPVPSPSQFDLPMPPAQPREWGLNPFDRPFLFKLGGTDKMTGRERENIVADQYQQILADLGSKVPEVEIKDLSGITALTIGGRPFVTVLPNDCPDYYGRLSDDLKKKLEHQVAEQWKSLLLTDLTLEAGMRAPDYLASYPYMAATLFFICLILHVAADVFARRWTHSPGWSFKLFIWLGWISACFFLHPSLKSMAATVGRGALLPVFLALLIGTLMNLLYQVGCRIIDYYVKACKRHIGGLRQEQRLSTMSHVARFLIGTVAMVGGIVWFLFAVGVPVNQFFAGAGIAGILLGVIGRDIIIDYFYGINILLEDQFSIGDWIEAGPISGTVVSFNLRTTHIREIDGGLSVVTNGMLNRLKNHSREWANADFRIGVAYGSNPDRCMALILDEVESLAGLWPEKLEKKPVMLGVQELGESSVVLRALVRTAPLAQWEVGRELNRRVLLRFEREGVEIPFPQRKIWIQPGDVAAGKEV